MRSATVVGSGPNGLAAAIVLAKAGVSTTLIEARDSPGGGMRSEALTLPGFIHDVCSAVHPLALSSPFFSALPLREHGLEWIHPPAALAHPFDDGSAAMLESSLAETCRGLGADGEAYDRAVRPFVPRWKELVADALAPIHWPAHPLLMARFGLMALRPAAPAARRLFQGRDARALFAGLAAHSVLPLENPGSSAIGWLLAIAAHSGGWPIPRGGSRAIADALTSYFKSLGGRLELGRAIHSIDELAGADAVLLDVAPRQFLRLAGDRLPKAFSRKLESFRYGPGVFKLDWALDRPIPWKAEACARAATVHLGGTLAEIAEAERAPWEGRVHDRPFVLLAQPSLFDPSRAPAGKHTAWAYCHVPHGSTADATERVEAQVERFAPGFRSTILARSAMGPAQLEARNPNLVGGDITGGAQNLGQLFLRPTRSLYRTPLNRVFLCSASTPPGGGVHGMCGFYAARAALKEAGPA